MEFIKFHANRSNRGSAIGPPRLDQAVALSCGFYDLMTFRNTTGPSTTPLF